MWGKVRGLTYFWKIFTRVPRAFANPFLNPGRGEGTRGRGAKCWILLSNPALLSSARLGPLEWQARVWRYAFSGIYAVLAANN